MLKLKDMVMIMTGIITEMTTGTISNKKKKIHGLGAMFLLKWSNCSVIRMMPTSSYKMSRMNTTNFVQNSSRQDCTLSCREFDRMARRITTKKTKTGSMQTLKFCLNWVMITSGWCKSGRTSTSIKEILTPINTKVLVLMGDSRRWE